MASQTKTPTILANLAGGGTAWTIPAQDALAEVDAAYATVELTTSDEYSQYLAATGFGFTLPADAVVTDIAVANTCKTSVALLAEQEAQMVVDGAAVAGKPAVVGRQWPTDEGALGYSKLVDATVTQINADDFGFAIRVQNDVDGATRTAYVNQIEMTVYYNSASEGMDWHSKDGFYSECDMCGFKYETAELTKQRGILVCPVCYDED